MQFLAEKRNRPTPNQPPSSALLSLAHHVPPSAHLYHGMMRSQLAAASSVTTRSHMRLQCAPKAAVVLRQTVTLSRKPENLLGRYRLLPSIVTTAPSIPVYGMLRGPASGCLAGHPLAASACGTNAKSPPHRAISEFRCKAENICAQRVYRMLTQSRPTPSADAGPVLDAPYATP